MSDPLGEEESRRKRAGPGRYRLEEAFLQEADLVSHLK